jgi:NADPH:quinone reductase-like Zn-dependent oxidoreductase
MRAMAFTAYGPPEVLQPTEVETPTPQDHEVLVQVHAASVVWADLAFVRGQPFISRLSSGLFAPKHQIPGMDLAGRVAAVGRGVTQLRPGDEVFGDVSESGFGAFAEYVCARQDRLARKPANISFEQAAAVPQAALVALQGLRDQGRLQPGQKVLINGASGGNGTFAVQLAKALGAEVTAVCSTRNLDLVRSLGADHVIDYVQEDFVQAGPVYDLILDIVANRPVRAYLRALKPHGTYVAVPFSAVALLLGPILSRFGSKKVGALVQKASREDLVFMAELLEAGQVVPVIGRQFPLPELAAALRCYEEEDPPGKVVITLAAEDSA